MMNWIKELVGKVWENIEDQLAKYIAYISIAIFLVLVLSLRNWAFSKHTVELYGWVWLSTPLLVIFLALIICSLFRNRLKNYRRDEIYGVIWKWNDYPESTSDDYYGLGPFCPKCFHGLKYGVVRQLPEFRCPQCSFSTDMLIEDFHGMAIWGYDGIVKRAHEEKERRIETGEYKKAKQRIKILRNNLENEA